MLPGLLALNVALWGGVLLYALVVTPRRSKSWSPNARRANLAGIAAAALMAAAASALSYQHSQQVQVRQKAQEYYHAGIDNVQRGDLTAAAEDFEKARALQPGHPQASEQLQKIQQQKTADRREVRREATVDPNLPPPASVPAPATAGANAPAPTNAPAPEPVKGTPGEKAKPAPHKPSPFEIIHYALDVDLDPAAHTLDATATVRVRSRGERIPVLDFSLNKEFKPASADVDGARAAFSHKNDLFQVTPTRPLEKNREATVTVHYKRSGPDPIVEGGDLISTEGTYLRSEARWYPATGELDFRAPVSVHIRVPKGYTAVSVGALKGVEKDEKTVRYHWETPKFASMVSLAAAKYVSQSVKVPPPAGVTRPELKVTCYTFPEHRKRAPEFLKEAAAMVRFYEERYGAYPYEKLAVTEIPLFPGGYGTTSFVMLIDKSFEEARLDREFLSHEIAHQWWGNSVFPQGLGAAWLTEAFANYSAWMYSAARAGNPRVLTKRVQKATADYLRAAARKGDQPIAETDPYQPVGASTQIVYEKGAVVLHMLRHTVGDRAFAKTLRAFADDFRFGKATIPDFRRIAERESGHDLGWFFDQWLGRTGGMSLEYSFETLPDSPKQNKAVLRIKQTGAAPYRAKLSVVLDVENSIRKHEIELTQAEQEFTFFVRGKLTTVLIDPDNVYLMKPPRWVVPDPKPVTAGD